MSVTSVWTDWCTKWRPVARCLLLVVNRNQYSFATKSLFYRYVTMEMASRLERQAIPAYTNCFCKREKKKRGEEIFRKFGTEQRTNKTCVSKPICARGGWVEGGGGRKSTFNDNIHNCYKHHHKRHIDTRGCETGL